MTLFTYFTVISLDTGERYVDYTAMKDARLRWSALRSIFHKHYGRRAPVKINTQGGDTLVSELTGLNRILCGRYTFYILCKKKFENTSEANDYRDYLIRKKLAHISVLCNHNPDITKFLLNWIANMIQYPEHKSVVPSVGTAIAAFGSSSKFVSASGKFVLSFFGLGFKAFILL